MTKRVLSLLLILVMLVGMLPVFAQAEETEASVDNGELTVEGTNGFGTLLAEDIAQEQEAMEEEQQAGYTLTDLQITGNTATVTYDSLEEATVVVALYTEDGMQLLTSGKTTVNPEETTATVTIEGTMPEYFMASAYLLDSYDMSPLCPAYDTPMYTKEMQDLLASTAEDYDPDRVLQLEENPETNFAVYAEGTKVIEPVEGVNTVASVDDETNTYVIENADENITSLQVGDVFAYPFGENEILIVKVATITVDGTTSTITGAELELEEVFEVAKIEGVCDSNNSEIDMSSADDGVVYLGKTSNSAQARSRNARVLANGSLSNELYHSFEINSNEDGEFNFKGSIKVYAKTTLEYYITRSYQRVTFQIAFGGEIEVGIEMTALDESKSLEKKLPTIPIELAPGVKVKFTPSLVAEFQVSIVFKFTYETTIGFGFEKDRDGFRFLNLCKAPHTTSSIEVEGKLFIGIKWTPELSILEGYLAEAAISGQVGFEFTGTIVVADFEKDSEKKHHCIGCIDGSVAVRLKITPSVRFFKWDKLKYSQDVLDEKWELFKFYVCSQHSKMGKGECPNVSYRITIQVTDENNSLVPGVHVFSGDDNDLGVTNNHGVLVTYLVAGEHTLTANIHDKTATLKITVSEADNIRLTTSSNTGFDPSGEPLIDHNILDNITEDDSVDMGIVDEGNPTASGTSGDNFSWYFYEDGTLYLCGSGEVDTTFWTWGTPWEAHMDSIKKVVIENGITNIGWFSFYRCSQLTSVIIPDSITRIEACAFADCTSLTSITLPASITSIGGEAFSGCKRLTSITIPEGVVGIGDSAFSNCTSLETVMLPESLVSLGVAFEGCKKLQYNSYDNGKYLGNESNPYVALINTINDNIADIAINSNTKIIGDGAVQDCTLLTDVTIPGNVSYIGNSAFSGCNNLNSLLLLEGVKAIRAEAFLHCDSLTNVTIPSSVANIGSSAFSSCDSLNSVVLCEGVESIGKQAFYGCDSLTSIIIPNTITNVGEDAFSGSNNLQYNYHDNAKYLGNESNPYIVLISSRLASTINIHSDTKVIGEYAFSERNSLTDVFIPDGVSHIGKSAFYGCSSLSSINIPNNITSIPNHAFSCCRSLTNIIIPNGVTSIGEFAFSHCDNLKNVVLPVSVTFIDYCAFDDCSSISDVYYCGTAQQWNKIRMNNYNTDLTNATIHYNYTGATVLTHTGTLSGQLGGQMSTAEAIFGGEYSTEVVDPYTIKTADFIGLVPGKEYVLLALVSLDAENPLDGENILFIDQATATEDGTLSFRYVQRESMELSYVMACGASNKDLNDAQITFPDMTADGETQVVQPTVVYEGKSLVEGQDYVITGEVDFTNPGEYTCYIRGIYQYTGLVSCTYTVTGEPMVLRGSVTTGTQGDTLVQLRQNGSVVAEATVSGATGAYRFSEIAPGTYTLQVSKTNHVTRSYEVAVTEYGAILNVKIHLIGDVSGDGRINVGDVARIYAYSKKTGELSDYEFLCADVSGDGRVNVGDASRVYGHSKKTSSLW